MSTRSESLTIDVYSEYVPTHVLGHLNPWVGQRVSLEHERRGKLSA